MGNLAKVGSALKRCLTVWIAAIGLLDIAPTVIYAQVAKAPAPWKFRLEPRRILWRCRFTARRFRLRTSSTPRICARRAARTSPTAYEPRFALSSDARSYRSVSGTERTLLDAPGLPISLSFWAGPGEESTILKAASAYEAATKHRRPPARFGPLPGEP